MAFRAVLIQALQQSEVGALLGGAHGLWARSVENGRLARTESHALVYGRKETRTPVDRPRRGLSLAAVKHHVCRQIRIGAAQRIGRPRAKRWAARSQVAGVHL